ncbi:DUF1565 domain-containing protein, partial [bacterium]
MIEALALLLTAGPTVHLSPSGVDTGSGTAGAPVRTLARALEIVRGKGGKLVLAPGDYPQTDTLELGEKESGIRIEGGGKARILGGKVVKGWRPVTDPAILERLAPAARDHVREVGLEEAGLTPGTLKYRGFADGKANSALELFADGKPMQIARYPNVGEWAETEAKIDGKTFSYS